MSVNKVMESKLQDMISMEHDSFSHWVNKHTDCQGVRNVAMSQMPSMSTQPGRDHYKT